MKTTQDLQAAHGTPAEFRRAVLDAIPEISIDEAMDAIEKYEREWHEAARLGEKYYAR